MKSKSSITLLVLILMLSACKDEKIENSALNSNYIKLVVQPYFGNEILNLDATHTTQEGYDIQFTDIKFYFQDVRFNSEQLVGVSLFDYRLRGDLLIRVNGELADTTGTLTGNIGVEAGLNHLDPSGFPNESMLNIVNANDMHWDWNPGYIFVKIEAKVDTIPDGIALFNHNVIFHVGLDENVQSLSIPNLSASKVENENVFSLKLDMKAFLEGPQLIDVKTESSSHSAAGQEALTLKVLQNFNAAITSF